MTIAFTGGGTGGHFYPIIAIAEALQDLAREKRLIEPKLYYLAPAPYNKQALFENSIRFIHIPAGKRRRYFSLRNFFDGLVTLWGVIVALITLFRLYPDVVVGKGGFGSVPAVIAAWILRIPIIVHESDAKPGRANLLAARLADRIAISFDSSAAYFPKRVQKRIARTGVPVRKALMRVEAEGARQYLGLERDIPTILILGGSQGAKKINEAVLTALPELVTDANVIHQTGKKHIKEVEGVGKVVLADNPHADRYHAIDYLDTVSMQRAASVADLIISRAGSTSITEIGIWKKPAILIPIPESISHDQRSNAYAYARQGGALIIEEENLSPHVFAAEIKRLLGDPDTLAKMSAATEGWADTDAGRVVAEEIISIAIKHES